MLYQRTASFCLLSLLCVLFAASAGAGDRLHVINREAALPPLTIELEELWRAGEGPGEVNGPVDLIQFPDGNFGLAEFFREKLLK